MGKRFNVQMAQYKKPTIEGENTLTLENNVKSILPHLEIEGNTKREPTLPDIYQEVEYIESSEKGPYIDTGYIPNQNTRVVCKFQSLLTTANYIFGVRTTSTTNVCYISAGASAWNLRFGATGSYSISGASDTNVHTIDMSKRAIIWDGTTQTDPEDTEFTAMGNMYIMSANLNGSPGGAAAKIYYCRIYENGEIIRNYIPCYRKIDNVVGLYDTVENKFYENATDGEFTKGPDIDSYPKINAPKKIINASGRLPNEYQEVDYLESTATQYIDTGVIPTSNTRLIGNFQFTQHYKGTTTEAINGTTHSNLVGRLAFGYTSAISSNNFYIGIADKNIDTGVPFYLYTYNIEIYGNGYWRINDTVGKEEVAELETDLSLFLFARNNNGVFNVPAKMRLYDCRIYENNVLIRDFIPCYRKSDKVLGLYDMVNNIFYTNNGTGKFKYGKEKYITVELKSLNEFHYDDLISKRYSGQYTQLPATNYKLKHDTEYTVRFDYEITECDFSKIMFSIGQGSIYYAYDIQYAYPLPNITSGTFTYVFKTKSEHITTLHPKLWFRIRRPETESGYATMSIRNLMVVEGRYDGPYEPYFDKTIINIPKSVTLDDGTNVDLRFARLGTVNINTVINKADTLIVDALNKKVIYKQNLGFVSLPEAYSTYTSYGTRKGVYFLNIMEQGGERRNGICTHSRLVGSWFTENSIWMGVNNGTTVYWYDILDLLDLADWKDGEQPTEEQRSKALTGFNKWLSNEKANNRPVEIIYELRKPIERDITNSDLGRELLNIITGKGTNILEISNAEDLAQNLTASHLTHK